MAKKKHGPPTRSFVGETFKRLAREIGAHVLVEPTWKTVGQISFKDGRIRYFRYSSVDLNPLGASEISKDKGYATFFLKRMGYPTVPGDSFYSPRWAEAIGSKKGARAALTYAERIGWPVIVKPNSGSQGKGVTLAHNKKEVAAALSSVFEYDDIALIQKYITGRDYRVVILDGVAISAYERTPLTIEGDGRSSIRTLLHRKQRSFQNAGRDTKIKLNDPRILQTLRHNNLAFKSILPVNQKLQLLANANLSTGGEAIDVTESMHHEWKKLAARVTRDMGLRLCGVDLLISGSITDPPKKYWVLETNAAPGLDHYVHTGARQQKIVEDMYRKVLKALESGSL